METKLSSIQKSSTLNNEPTLSASEFDKKLLKFVKDFCSPFEDMRKCLADVRIAATVEKETKGQDLPLWPLDTCYVYMNYLVYLYSVKYIEPKLAQNPHLLDDESQLYDMIIQPNILGGCFSWDMVRNVVHVNNKQLDNSLLDRPCSSLAKLPQWAICFNTVENNIVLDGKTIVGVIFYRNFTHMPPLESLEIPVVEAKCLDGEPAASVNHLNSIIIFHNGMINIGPQIDLCDSGSVKSYLDDYSQRIKECSNVMELSKEHTSEELVQIAKRTTKDFYGIFALLPYLLENLDKLKNEKGEKVSFAPNPEPFKTKKGYRLFGSDRISSYYLD